MSLEYKAKPEMIDDLARRLLKEYKKIIELNDEYKKACIDLNNYGIMDDAIEVVNEYIRSSNEYILRAGDKIISISDNLRIYSEILKKAK